MVSLVSCRSVRPHVHIGLAVAQIGLAQVDLASATLWSNSQVSARFTSKVADLHEVRHVMSMTESVSDDFAVLLEVSAAQRRTCVSSTAHLSRQTITSVVM